MPFKINPFTGKFDQVEDISALETHVAGDGSDHADVVTNTAARHTQGTDTALGAQAENLDMNTHKIEGVVDPTANQEAATKKYVDDNAGADSGLVESTLTNKCGANTIVGYVYRLDPDNDASFDYAPDIPHYLNVATNMEVFQNYQVCVAQTAGIADASTTSVVLAGVCEVYLDGVVDADIDLGVKYLYFGDTDGQAFVSTRLTDGCFGEAIEDSSGAGLSTCLIYPRERIRKWGWADEQGWKGHIKIPFTGQDDWTPYASNPVFEKSGVGASFDENGVGHPCVKYFDGWYYLWFVGQDAAGFGKGIGVARSRFRYGPFTRYGSNPIVPLTGAYSKTDLPAAIYDDFETDSSKVWKLWLRKIVVADSHLEVHLYYASTPFGAWTAYGANPVIDLGGSVFSGITVVKVGRLYYMVEADSNVALYIRTSKDGITWSSRATILSVGAGGTWYDEKLAYAGVFWNLGVWYVFFYGDDGTDWHIGMITSYGDGKTYAHYYNNPIYTGTAAWELSGGNSRVWNPTVQMVTDEFLMWYGGDDGTNKAIGLLTCP